MDAREGGDIFAEDFLQDLNHARDVGPTEIQKFYENSTIFVTGGTGFIGRLLVEKLLRSCPRIKKMYILIRPRKGKNSQQRFQEFFEGPVFDRLKQENPNFRQQINPVTGDCSLENFGLSTADQKKLIREVEVIFHLAATVNYDETLRTAVAVNIKGTKIMLEMAKQMRNLKALVFLSTAYSNCINKEIKEEFYEPPIEHQKITNLVELLDDRTLQALAPTLINQWPNTYTYTKLIAEDVVREFGKRLPIGIIRPSIVISTAKEPIAGWINNLYGPQGVVFATGIGLLRTLHCKPWVLADMVPVDLLINGIIAFGWDLGQTRGDNPNCEIITSIENCNNCESNIPILNFVSSERKPLTWQSFMHYNFVHGLEIPSVHQIWYSCVILTPNYYLNLCYQWLLHMFPAILFDGLAYLLGKQPMLCNAYKKIHKFSKVISHFSTNQWKFHDDNLWKLWNKVSSRDKDLFNFNIATLDWDNYFYTYIRGLRIYIVNDDMSTVPKARFKFKMMKIAHYTIISLLYCLAAYFIIRSYCFIFP